MKALITTAVVSFATLFTGLAQAEVSTRYKIVAADQAPESNLCVVAATQGIQTARKQAFQQGLDLQDTRAIQCNGKDIYRFSRQYRGKAFTTGVASASVGTN